MNYSSSSNRQSRRSQGASSPVPLNLKYIENDEDEPDDDSPTLSEKDGTLYNKDGSRVEPDMPLDATKTDDDEKRSNDSIKNNPLLTPVIGFLFNYYITISCSKLFAKFMFHPTKCSQYFGIFFRSFKT